MHVSLRLHNAVVHIPTSYRVQGHGFWVEDAPLESVPVGQTQRLQHAVKRTIGRGNPSISGDQARSLIRSKDDPRLKAMGAISWSALDRQTRGLWSITDRTGVYQIRVDEPMKPRGWHEDKTKRVEFPLETSIDDVIERLIAMIQDAAGQ